MTMKLRAITLWNISTLGNEMFNATYCTINLVKFLILLTLTTFVYIS